MSSGGYKDDAGGLSAVTQPGKSSDLSQSRQTILLRTSSQRTEPTEKKVETKKKDQKKLAGWKHALSGAVAGVCEVLGTMPLDVAKTNLQMHPGKYSGPIDALMKIAKTGGPKALYYGTTPFMLQTSGKAAIRFTAFAEIKSALEYTMGPGHGAQVNLWAGLLAGVVESAVWTTPTERIKVLRQTEVSGTSNRYGNIFSATKYIVQTQGVRGMFVGLVPTSIRQASSVGVRMALYPFIKERFPEKGGVLTQMISGGLVGGFSVILNNPVDVIKSLTQAGRTSASGKPLGMLECASLIYQESGLKGFGRGLSARFPRVFCGQAITFAVYEQMAALLSTV